jgi:hypothetical protein
MKQLIFATLFLVPVIATAIPGDSLPDLEIGKRADWLFSRTIKPENIARWETAGNRIFFRSKYQSDYQPIGYMGKNIEPYFKGNPSAETSFDKFQKNKKWSIVCQAGGIAAGIYTLVNFFKALGPVAGIESDKSYGLNAGLGLIAAIGLGIEYRILSAKSERHLLEAVHVANGLPAKTSLKDNYKASFGLSSDQSPGLALRLRF